MTIYLSIETVRGLVPAMSVSQQDPFCGRRAIRGRCPESEPYSCRLHLFMPSICDELCDWRSETLLSNNIANDGVHEHSWISRDAQLRLQIDVHLSTLNCLGYRDINETIESCVFPKATESVARLTTIVKVSSTAEAIDSFTRLVS